MLWKISRGFCESVTTKRPDLEWEEGVPHGDILKRVILLLSAEE